MKKEDGGVQSLVGRRAGLAAGECLSMQNVILTPQLDEAGRLS